MARIKNALTKYYIAKYEEGKDIKEVEWLRLAKWIPTVTDETDEDVESVAFYDGDGTPEDDVMTVKKGYTFEGMFDSTDEAHKLIRSMEMKVGEGRKIFFKQERTDGSIYTGKATASDIVTTGGDAEEFEPLEVKITWDRLPTISNEEEDNTEEPGNGTVGETDMLSSKTSLAKK